MSNEEKTQIQKVENVILTNEFNDTKSFFHVLNKINNNKIKMDTKTNFQDTNKKFHLPRLDLEVTKNSFHKNIEECILKRDTSRIKADLKFHNNLPYSP